MNSKFQSTFFETLCAKRVMINSTLTKRIPPPRIPLPPFKEMPLKFKLLLGAAVVGDLAFYGTIFAAALKIVFPFPH